MTVTVGDAIHWFFNASTIGVALFIIVEHFLKRKYERIARDMFKEGRLVAGTIWQHYKNEKFYTIQVVSNYYAHGSDWPLTVTYMTANGYAIYSRPAHEFVRKFKLKDNESNASETPLDRLVALAAYAANKIDFPAVGSKWYHEFAVPTGRYNAVGHMEFEQEISFAVVDSVTNKDQPCPYVNYRDEKGNLHTITLHHFRTNFLLQRNFDRLPVEYLILSARNLQELMAKKIFSGDTLTVNSIQGDEVVFECFGILAVIELTNTDGIYIGEQYRFEKCSLQHVTTNQEKGTNE